SGLNGHWNQDYIVQVLPAPSAASPNPPAWRLWKRQATRWTALRSRHTRRPRQTRLACLWQCNALKQQGDRAVAADALGFRFVGQQYAITQHIRGDRMHVFGRHVIATSKPGVSARTAIQCDRAARARAVGDPARELGTELRGFA